MRSHHRRARSRFVLLLVTTLGTASAYAQPITAAGAPAQLDVRVAGERSIRITLKPVSFKDDFPVNPAVVGRRYATAALSLRDVTRPVRRKVGALTVDVRSKPLTVRISNDAGALVQEIVFESDGTLS